MPTVIDQLKIRSNCMQDKLYFLPVTSKNDKVKVEGFQKLCTRIKMIPYGKNMKRHFHCLSSKS